MIHNCFVCGKAVPEVWDPSEERMIPESLYWYSKDYGPDFTEVFCEPRCMLIRHYLRDNKIVPVWLL